MIGQAAFGDGGGVGGRFRRRREEIGTALHDSLGEESLDAALLLRLGVSRLCRLHRPLLDFAQRVGHRLQRPTENDRALFQRQFLFRPIPSWLLHGFRSDLGELRRSGE